MSNSHWSHEGEGVRKHVSGILIDLGSDQDSRTSSPSEESEGGRDSPVAPFTDPTGSTQLETVEDATQPMIEFSSSSTTSPQSSPNRPSITQLPSNGATPSSLSEIASRAHQQISAKKPSRWVKTTPQLDKKDAERQSKAQKDAALARLRREPSPTVECPDKSVFFWPRDGPSIEEVLGENLEKLDPIRLKTGVSLYLHTEIRVVGANRAAHLEAIEDIRKLYNEAVAKSDIRIRAYLVEPPPGPLKRHKIGLVEPEPFSRAYIRREIPSTLRQNHVSMSEIASESYRIQRRNHNRLLDAIKQCLSELPLSSGVARMRVHFGTFILNRFPKGPARDLGFDFDDFCSKLDHERVEGHVVPGLNVDDMELLRRCSTAEGFLEPITPMLKLDSVLTWDPVFSASFQFFSKSERPVRLEVIFKSTPGSREMEIESHSWSKARDGDDFSLRLPLQIGVIDFAKSDWQVDVEFFEEPEDAAIKDHMQEFLKSIKFDSFSLIGRNPLFFSDVVRRVQFSEDAKLTSAVEKTALRFRVNGTPYVLELARFSQFSGIKGVKPDRTGWGATLFNPAWDEMFEVTPGSSSGEASAECSNLSDERAMRKRFKAFFPKKEGMVNWGDDKDGFDDFMVVVQRVSEFLRPAWDSQKIEDAKPSMKGLLDVELGGLF